MKTNTKLILIFLLAIFITIPVVSATISYTETMEQIDETDWNNDAWNTDEDVGNAPVNSIAEIICLWDSVDSNGYVGIRNTTSTLSRFIQLNEAEDGGNSTLRMYVTVDDSGNADFYGGANADYYLVGYWTGITFEEDWKTYQVTSAQDDMWYEIQSGFNLKQNRATHIIITNDDAGKNQYGGVRNTTSVYDLDRRQSIIESEGGGNTTIDYWVQTDSNGYIDVYSEQFDDIFFINEGCFNSSIAFEEFSDLISSGLSVWQQTGDMSADWWFNVGTIIDISILNSNQVEESYGGIRTTSSSLDRKFKIRESEGAGTNGHGNSVKVGIGISGKRIELYDDTGLNHRVSGFFKIPPPIIGDITLLFGGGFNHSAPYIYIKWGYVGDVDNYEIQHSTDNITYTLLVMTTNKYYNHTGLVNGSYHYYKIRSTVFTDTWFNSSFSTINLERVWFIHGGGGGGGGVIITYINGTWNNSLPITIESIVASIEGNQTQLNQTDRLIFNITEIVGSPAFSTEFNFTVNDNSININLNLYALYDGNIGHNVTLEAFNYTLNDWVILTQIPDGVVYKWFNVSLSAYRFSDFIDNNILYTRVHHYSAGNINHHLHIDYFKVRYFEPTGLAVGGGAIGLFNNFIIMGILSLIAVVGNKIRVMK